MRARIFMRTFVREKGSSAAAENLRSLPRLARRPTSCEDEIEEKLPESGVLGHAFVARE